MTMENMTAKFESENLNVYEQKKGIFFQNDTITAMIVEGDEIVIPDGTALYFVVLNGTYYLDRFITSGYKLPIWKNQYVAIKEAGSSFTALDKNKSKALCVCSNEANPYFQLGGPFEAYAKREIKAMSYFEGDLLRPIEKNDFGIYHGTCTKGTVYPESSNFCISLFLDDCILKYGDQQVNINQGDFILRHNHDFFSIVPVAGQNCNIVHLSLNHISWKNQA